MHINLFVFYDFLCVCKIELVIIAYQKALTNAERVISFPKFVSVWAKLTTNSTDPDSPHRTVLLEKIVDSLQSHMKETLTLSSEERERQVFFHSNYTISTMIYCVFDIFPL